MRQYNRISKNSLPKTDIEVKPSLDTLIRIRNTPFNEYATDQGQSIRSLLDMKEVKEIIKREIDSYRRYMYFIAKDIKSK